MVMSTTLLIGRWPAAISRARSHSGEGPISTSTKARAVKRGQSSGTSTRTEAISETSETPPVSSAPAGSASVSHGAAASSAPVKAWTSRATP